MFEIQTTCICLHCETIDCFTIFVALLNAYSAGLLSSFIPPFSFAPRKHSTNSSEKTETVSHNVFQTDRLCVLIFQHGKKEKKKQQDVFFNLEAAE